MPFATLYHYHLDRGSAVPVPGKTEAFRISGTTELNKSVDLVSSFLLARSVPFRNGLRTGSDVTGMGADDALGRLSFVDADTVQVHRGSGDGSAPQFFARGTAVEFASSMVASVQRGSIALGGGVTSNTATISSVDLTRSVVVFLGNDSDTATIDRIFPKVSLTNATTVTASRTSGTGTIRGKKRLAAIRCRGRDANYRLWFSSWQSSGGISPPTTSTSGIPADHCRFSLFAEIRVVTPVVRLGGLA